MVTGIRLEPVSMGKGFVEWHVVYPSLVKKNPGVGQSFEDLEEACRVLKRHLTESEVDPKTVRLIEEHAADGDWGSDRAIG